MTDNNVRNFVFASIISADNETIEEEVKQQILERYHLIGEPIDGDDWRYILQPIEDNDYIEKLTDLLNCRVHD